MHDDRTMSNLTWRQMIRLPEEWGGRVERLADDYAVPVGTMLRLLVREGLETMERKRDVR
jgi:predicted DNA-binding protein